MMRQKKGPSSRSEKRREKRKRERERETDTETEQTKGATHATGQQHKHTLTTLTKSYVTTYFRLLLTSNYLLSGYSVSSRIFIGGGPPPRLILGGQDYSGNEAEMMEYEDGIIRK